MRAEVASLNVLGDSCYDQYTSSEAGTVYAAEKSDKTAGCNIRVNASVVIKAPITPNGDLLSLLSMLIWTEP